VVVDHAAVAGSVHQQSEDKRTHSLCQPDLLEREQVPLHQVEIRSMLLHTMKVFSSTSLGFWTSYRVFGKRWLVIGTKERPRLMLFGIEITFLDKSLIEFWWQGSRRLRAGNCGITILPLDWKSEIGFKQYKNFRRIWLGFGLISGFASLSSRPSPPYLTKSKNRVIMGNGKINNQVTPRLPR